MIILLLIVCIITGCHVSHGASPKVAIIGYSTLVGSTDRLSLSITDTIRPEVDSFIINMANYDQLNLKDRASADIALLTEHVWIKNRYANPLDFLPSGCKLTLALSFTETTIIPNEWVKIYNEKCDALLIADESVYDIYRKCGVTIPIFVLPIPLYLGDFLKMPLKSQAHEVFTFGCSAGFWDRKNHEKLIDGFAKAFGKSTHVRLILHGRHAFPETLQAINQKIKEYGLNNVEILLKEMTHEEYLDFLKKIDCYVLLSKGEGFSITPREALAMGLPCILSNNTTHQMLCNLPFILSVTSDIKSPVGSDYVRFFGEEYKGFLFDCLAENAALAMKKVYENYTFYLSKSPEMREFAKQYDCKQLSAKYITLLSPNKIVLGDRNSIENGYLVTNSKELFEKYKVIINKDT